MREIGAFDAKNRLGQLLDRVEAGEEVIITRHGRVVAKLVPPDGSPNSERARSAAARIRARRRGMTLGGIRIKDLINEGRP
jgi:prevent-host-death family protein